MKVPLYILGFLVRYGPQHGYLLKQYLEQVSDFASIKLPTVYYHLEKMEKKGLISASREKEGKRPEKWVYTITEEGNATLHKLLKEALAASYQGEFLLDSVLYFNDLIPLNKISDACSEHARRLEKRLKTVNEHQEQILKHVPKEAKVFTRAIFSHHIHHIHAELAWLKETLNNLSLTS